MATASRKTLKIMPKQTNNADDHLPFQDDLNSSDLICSNFMAPNSVNEQSEIISPCSDVGDCIVPESSFSDMSCLIREISSDDGCSQTVSFWPFSKRDNIPINSFRVLGMIFPDSVLFIAAGFGLGYLCASFERSLDEYVASRNATVVSLPNSEVNRAPA